MFFSELGLPKPDINLGIRSGSHTKQTSTAMIHLESLIEKFKLVGVIVYGDSNSILDAVIVHKIIVLSLLEDCHPKIIHHF